MSKQSKAQRLEDLWSGDFGDAYVERNAGAAKGRDGFWAELISELAPKNVLEVGCNLGANLEWIAKHLEAKQVFGVDINESALSQLRSRLPGVQATLAPARKLPYADAAFDLVFTMGVLIHQDPESLAAVMKEIVRCSRRYIICGEYFADKVTEVPYRGETGALWKRDFGGLYRELFPGLRLIKKSFLSKAQGWDDVTVWVFEKAAEVRK